MSRLDDTHLYITIDEEICFSILCTLNATIFFSYFSFSYYSPLNVTFYACFYEFSLLFTIIFKWVFFYILFSIISQSLLCEAPGACNSFVVKQDEKHSLYEWQYKYFLLLLLKITFHFIII